MISEVQQTASAATAMVAKYTSWNLLLVYPVYNKYINSLLILRNSHSLIKILHFYLYTYKKYVYHILCSYTFYVYTHFYVRCEHQFWTAMFWNTCQLCDIVENCIMIWILNINFGLMCKFWMLMWVKKNVVIIRFNNL